MLETVEVVMEGPKWTQQQWMESCRALAHSKRDWTRERRGTIPLFGIVFPEN